MNTEEKTVGVAVEDMKLSDLKQLCTENNLDIKGLTTKDKIINVIKKWEKKLLKKTEIDLQEMGATITMRKHKGADQVLAKIKEEFYEGKLVISRTPLDLNGVAYEDIVVKGGITYRVPIIK